MASTSKNILSIFNNDKGNNVQNSYVSYIKKPINNIFKLS